MKSLRAPWVLSNSVAPYARVETMRRRSSMPDEVKTTLEVKPSTTPTSETSKPPEPQPKTEDKPLVVPGASSNGAPKKEEKRESRDAIYEELLKEQKATREELQKLREDREADR